MLPSHSLTGPSSLISTHLSLFTLPARWDRKYWTTYKVLDILQKVFYRSNPAREAFVEMCEDSYVQKMTFDSYLYKTVVPGEPEGMGWFRRDFCVTGMLCVYQRGVGLVFRGWCGVVGQMSFFSAGGRLGNGHVVVCESPAGAWQQLQSSLD